MNKKKKTKEQVAATYDPDILNRILKAVEKKVTSNRPSLWEVLSLVIGVSLSVYTIFHTLETEKKTG